MWGLDVPISGVMPPTISTMDTYYLALAFIIIFFLCQRLFRYPQPSLSSLPLNGLPANPSVTKSSKPRAVRLFQVYPTPENDAETDVDIIAIHGLDTNSSDTWTWKEPGKPNVNWLTDENMLPCRVAAARIFMCDWPCDLFERSGYSQKTFDEFARLLLAGIAARPQPENYSKYKERPILFIASCIGGVILMKALVRTSPEYSSIQKAVRGIVFLATPFSGTSFCDVAEWALPGLKTWAFIRTKKVSNLLYETMWNPELENLRRDFVALYQKDIHMAAFYETGKTSLPRKLIPWLPAFLAQRKPLVGRGSAILDVIHDPLPLERTHLLMNKFSGHSDEQYKIVVGRICYILDKIRKGQTLEMADAYINNTRYKARNLEIERISGELLPMERCYINLVIIDQLLKKQEKDQDKPQYSQFSLDNRLKTFTPPEEMQIDMRRLFDQRKGDNGSLIRPRRILIRGHAGVGKSTLCKKIVHDFRELDMWRNIFVRILWVPLRNLKRLNKSTCNLQAMLYEEYFTQTPKGNEFACELWKYLEEENYKNTLFILDGLDEVYEGLDKDNYMFNLLETLLNLPTIILTSRPHVSLADHFELKFDLELETVGFYPHQVNLYIENVFTPHAEREPDHQKIDGLRVLLQQHQLLQGLIRIPIQLDALCYIWSDEKNRLRDGSALETMTGIYQTIVEMLWKKDIPRLQKKDRGEIISRIEIRGTPLEMIEAYVCDELYLLEGLAFTGMVNDRISFTRNDFMRIMDRGSLQILHGKTLPRLSFLRTSNPSSREPIYHFLHLTFQEYFAARYFVRHWNAKKPLLLSKDGPSKGLEIFVAHNKYDARYNIFWRFVSGLLSLEDEEIGEFFRLIGDEPRDHLGSVHERLIMYCLSEVPSGKAAFSSGREELEHELERWLTFETSKGRTRLACETEFPGTPLTNVLQSVRTEERKILVESLKYCPAISPRVIHLLCHWLQRTGIDNSVKVAILSLLARYQGALYNKVLAAIVACLKDDKLQKKAVRALERWSPLRSDILNAVVTQAIDKGHPCQREAIKVLGKHSQLDGKVINALAEQLEKKTRVSSRIVKTLASQSHLGEKPLSAILAQLQNTGNRPRRPRLGAIKALQKHLNLSDDTFRIITSEVEKKREKILWAVVKVLGSRPQPDDEVEDFIRAQLNKKEWRSRKVVMAALWAWPQLTHGIIEDIKTQATNQKEHPDVRSEAIKTLMNHQQVDDMHEMIAIWLQDEATDLRCKVLLALKGLPQPCTKIVDMVVAQLEEKSASIKVFALRALHDWPQLSNNALDAIAKQLSDSDDIVQDMASKAFLNRPRPKDSIIKEIVARLSRYGGGKKEKFYPETLLETLQTWSPLENYILYTVVRLLRTAVNNERARIAALQIFRAHPEPNNDIIKCVKDSLKDPDSLVREEALGVLGSWPNPKDELLVTIAVCLEDEEWNVKEAAFYALTNRLLLPFGVLKPHMESMYKVALEISFEKHVYWHTGIKQSFIVVGSRKVDWIMMERRTQSMSESGLNIGSGNALWLRNSIPVWREQYRASAEASSETSSEASWE